MSYEIHEAAPIFEDDVLAYILKSYSFEQVICYTGKHRPT